MQRLDVVMSAMRTLEMSTRVSDVCCVMFAGVYLLSRAFPLYIYPYIYSVAAFPFH